MEISTAIKIKSKIHTPQSKLRNRILLGAEKLFVTLCIVYVGSSLLTERESVLCYLLIYLLMLYRYTYDGGNTEIQDGGHDMYDGGNQVN